MDASTGSTETVQKVPRVGIIDTARGIALLAMASYHFCWDLEFFGYLDPGSTETGWLKLYARIIASSFLFLAGVSLVLANSPTFRRQAFLKRLAMILAGAGIITLVTWFMTPDAFIFFGILHNIAAVSLIGLLFLRIPVIIVWVVAALLAVGIYVDNVGAPFALHSTAFDSQWLWWLGLSENIPRSNDYVPLFPWLTPFMFGIALARLGLARGWFLSLAKLPSGGSLIARTGRHGLSFYLLHQPLLFGLVYVISVIAPAPKPDPTVGYLKSCQTSCQQSGSEALCRSFCQCTLDRLQTEKLFTPWQRGQVSQDDPRITALAEQCSAAAQ